MKDYMCTLCFRDGVEYLCPLCLKPIFPIDIFKLNIHLEKYPAINKEAKYYYCWRCREEKDTIRQTLVKEEDLIKLKNKLEGEMSEITMNLIMIESKPAFYVTVNIGE